MVRLYLNKFEQTHYAVTVPAWRYTVMNNRLLQQSRQYLFTVICCYKALLGTHAQATQVDWCRGWGTDLLELCLEAWKILVCPKSAALRSRSTAARLPCQEAIENDPSIECCFFTSPQIPMHIAVHLCRTICLQSCEPECYETLTKGIHGIMQGVILVYSNIEGCNMQNLVT